MAGDTRSTTTATSGNGGSSTTEESTQTAKIAAAAHSAVDTAADNLVKAERALREARAAAGHRLSESAHDARESSEQAMDSVRTYIDLHPLRSVGIAFAAGYLASVLLRK